MSWSEIKKALNTDLNTPLNTLITNAKDSLASAIATVQSTVNTINTNAANANSNANTAKTNAANANTNAANAYTAAVASACIINNIPNLKFSWLPSNFSVSGKGILYGLWLYGHYTLTTTETKVIVDGTEIANTSNSINSSSYTWGYNTKAYSNDGGTYPLVSLNYHVNDVSKAIYFTSSLSFSWGNNRDHGTSYIIYALI